MQWVAHYFTPCEISGLFSVLLSDMEAMRQVVEHAATKLNSGRNDDDEVKQLRSQKSDLEASESNAEAGFAATLQHLKDAKLPAEIINRQNAALAEFRAKQSVLKQKLKTIEDADNAHDKNRRVQGVRDLAAFMTANQHRKIHAPVDPDKLPFGASRGKVRAPVESTNSYRAKQAMFGIRPVLVAGPIPNGLTFPSTSLPAAPTADDLSATEDVQITQAIKDQAASLNNNPVKIYNWVRNNIEFLPTYGSIQGADMTLQAKRGNAFDTASLLIGLMRAAGIPARYVYGTIQLPVDQAMNWVGGVTKPEAALELLAQGGIPSIGISSGGLIRSVDLEHVWVEAYVDYVPSRGAVNKKPNTWVPMDASFKQYAYTQGMDIKTNVPLDAQTLATQAQTGATVDPSGWVQNINGAAIQSALTGYQAQVQTYIDSQKANATVGDVLGTKTITQQNIGMLTGSLPYRTVAVGGKFDSLPLQVRHQFQYNLYASAMDRATDSPVFSFQQSLPSIAGKKITLSFAPASSADASLIASYLPKPHADGTPILPAELPASLPGYLIHLTAELRLDGQVVETGGSFTMGSDLIANMGLYDPVNGWAYGNDSNPTAGEYIATHVDLQGVSSGELQALKDRLTGTQTKLAAAQYAGITKEDLSGDILYSAALGYFAANQAASRIAQRAAGVVEYFKPSFGNFLATARTAYWFGIPRSVSFPGLMMDIQRYAVMNVAKDYNSATDISYNRQSGMRASAYEHLIPEKLFTDQTQPNAPQAISAVKALAIAASQGQKIYTITQANQDILLPQINVDPDVMTEMQNALSIGKEVTVHQSPITQSGWTGTGYIITDPATGAGAYKISGGANGAYLYMKEYLKEVIPEVLLVDTMKGAFLTSYIEILMGDALKHVIENPAICLSNEERHSFDSAWYALNWISRGTWAGLPSLTIPFAVLTGWQVLAYSLLHVVNLNNALGVCNP
jgi:hypothetical protein